MIGFTILLSSCGLKDSIALLAEESAFCASHGFETGKSRGGVVCPLDGAVVWDCKPHVAWHLRHGEVVNGR